MGSIGNIGKERLEVYAILISLIGDWSNLGTIIFEAFNLINSILIFGSATTVSNLRYQLICVRLEYVPRKFHKVNDTLSYQDLVQSATYHFGGVYALNI